MEKSNRDSYEILIESDRMSSVAFRGNALVKALREILIESALDSQDTVMSIQLSDTQVNYHRGRYHAFTEMIELIDKGCK